MSSEVSGDVTGPAPSAAGHGAADLDAAVRIRRRDVAGCAVICRLLGEPLIGTAPTAASGWLLIEHPGPWPAYGLPPDLPVPIARFADAALGHAVRTQLIRRPDRTGRQVGAATVMLAGGPPGGRWLERGTLADLGALTRLDLAELTRSGPPGFGTRADAALLVCTHARREVCCARFGRPVARALAAHFGPMVWETTHVGGDRFAANLVVLPSGAYYGRLDPEDAVRVAQAALAGRVTLNPFRGVAGLPEAAQAAECFLRRALGAVDGGAVRYINEYNDGDDCEGEHLGPDGTSGPRCSPQAHGQHGRQPDSPYRIHRMRFAVSGVGVHTVTLARYQAACPRLTSCGSGTVETPAGYRLLGISGPLADPVRCEAATAPAVAARPLTSAG